jgi:hypothetical protein
MIANLPWLVLASESRRLVERAHKRWHRLGLRSVGALAYATGRLALRNPDLRGFSHLVASREGLFAVHERAWSLVAAGHFFGLTKRGEDWFAFESCDLPRLATARGRVVRLGVREGRIARVDVVARGLANGCHQIDFIDGRLCVLDTYAQRVLIFSDDFRSHEARHPLPGTGRRPWRDGYAHCNSLIQLGDSIVLMLHNGGDKTGLPSQLLVTDRQWRPLRTALIPGRGCHNVVMLETGELLACGSLGGELITSKRVVRKIDAMMTRGLSVDDETIVVGSSLYAAREQRMGSSGHIHFLDRSYRTRATLALPAAPTEVRRLDGRDFSLSGHARERLAGVVPWI